MKRGFILLLAALPLAACVGAGNPHVANTRLPAAFEAPIGVAEPAAALDRWWTLYGDAELEKLVDQALINAPDARTAASRLEEAQATRKANLRLAYPTGQLGLSASHSDSNVLAGDLLNFPGFSNSGGSDSFGANFNVSWEIDMFGRVRQGRWLIESTYQATRFDIEASRAALAASVADSLFGIRGLALQLADARETARIRAELADIAQRRVEHGLSAGSDLDRTASDLAQANAVVVQQEADLQAARRQLLVLIGQGTAPIATLPAVAVAPRPAPAPPATLPGDLLQRRPDVREGEQRLRAAMSQNKIDRLALFPTFTIRPGLGLQRSDQPSLSSTTFNWSLGAGLTVPVLDRGRLKKLADVSDARAEQAAIAYEKTVQTAYSEAESAMVQLAADENRVALLTAGEVRARSAYEAARKRYAAGLEDLTATLSAEQSWRAARTNLIGAQVQALRRSVQTFKALGGGWTPPPGGAA